MADELKVLGLSGSLRRGSYNTAALRAAVAMAPEGMTIEIMPIDEVPLYNEDLRQERGYSPPVQALREGIRAADGVLIVTPEYNYSIPGVLKNAIDWASRPPDQPFAGKPVAIMGASPGRLGTARAQYHLRQSFLFMDALVMIKPEVMIGGANRKFDAEGSLTDEETAGYVRDLLQGFAEWIRFVRRGRGQA